MASAAGVKKYAWEIFSVWLTLEEAERCVSVYGPNRSGDDVGWENNSKAVSVGPAIRLKSQLMEFGYLDRNVTSPDDDDTELLPIVWRKDGKKRRYVAVISNVARSKMFTTAWKVVLPIDITAMRVAGTE